MENKEWRTIAEASKYEVSNYGDVRNKKTLHELVGSKDRDGYGRVNIVNNEGKSITRFRHRLAAMAFLPNPNNYPVINHKDEVKTNNYIGCAENNYEDSNLEWCTQKYNLHYNNGCERRAEAVRETFRKQRLNGELSKWGKQVYVYKYDTKEFVGVFPSMYAAAKETHSDYHNVWRVANKERSYTNNYYFSFEKL